MLAANGDKKAARACLPRIMRDIRDRRSLVARQSSANRSRHISKRHYSLPSHHASPFTTCVAARAAFDLSFMK
jgi:hypothetical protein